VTKVEKLRQRFLSKPRDFTWRELVTLLKGLGYRPRDGGATGGSRVRFVHPDRPPLLLHRPHPSPVLKRYQLDQIEEVLRTEGLL